MHKLTILALASCLFLCAVASAQDENPIRKKLDAAKAAYLEDMEKFRLAVVADLEQREQTARSKGDSKLVEQAKADELAFDLQGDIPRGLPPMVKQKAIDARSALERAFRAAEKEFTKAKMDDEANETKRDLELIMSEGLFFTFPDSDRRRLRTHEGGYFIKGVGKDWFEKWDQGRKPPLAFTEVSRTANYVELRGLGDNKLVRLYGERCDVKFANWNEFKESYYIGKWDSATNR
jgi:hypothetical protein